MSLTCAHCGKSLTTPHHVLGLTLGPECVKKYAALEAICTANHLTFPQSFPMVKASEDGFVSSDALKTFQANAARLGIRLALETDWTQNPPVDTVTGIRKFVNHRIATWAETRNQFAQQLQGGVTA
jgi:hypothetical protein